MTSNSRLADGCAAGLLLGLFVLGGALWLVFLLKPAAAILAARSWTEQTCVIVSSELARAQRSSSDREMYRVRVHYRWQVDGRVYEGERYDFFGGASGDLGHWQKILGRYPAGATVACYREPRDAASAVIDRSFGAGNISAAIIASIVFLVGIVGLTALPARIRSLMGGSDQRRRSAFTPAVALSTPGSDGYVALRPRSSRLARSVVAVSVALLWNAAALSLARGTVPLEPGAAPAAWTGLLALLLAAIGLWLLLRAVWVVVRAAGPRVTVRVAASPIRLGERLTVKWEAEVRREAVSSIEVALVGRELATARSVGVGGGWMSRTRQRIFRRLPLVGVGVAAKEVATATVPIDTVPSLKGVHNEIEWTIVVNLKRQSRPALTEEFPITLLPAALETRS